MRTLLRRSRIRSCTSSPEGVTPTRSGWTITIYAIGQVLAMPMAGKISDMYGRKKVLLVSVLVFNAASLACGFANDIYLLVGLRMVRALGGGAFMPSGMGLSVPASNNASLQLAPDQVASIAGLRGMFPPVRVDHRGLGHRRRARAQPRRRYRPGAFVHDLRGPARADRPADLLCPRAQGRLARSGDGLVSSRGAQHGGITEMTADQLDTDRR